MDVRFNQSRDWLSSATQRLSSGGAGGSVQAAPDKASLERCYPALTCNELLGSPLAETTQRDFLPLAETTQALMRGAWLRLIQAALSKPKAKRPNAGIQVAARAAFKRDFIFELERRAIAAHLQ